MRAIAAALGILVVLSGCSGGSPDSAVPTSTPGAVPASFSETTGGIEGVVTNEEQAPLGGAQIGLIEASLTTASDADGRFTFSDLAPGTYTIQVAALGYQSTAKRVDVRAGEVASTVASLSAVLIEEAYVNVLHQRGILGCAIQVDPVTGVSVCGVGQIITLLTGQNTSSIDRFRTVWQLTDPSLTWNTSVMEMVWQSTQAFGGGLRVVLEVDLCSGDPDLTFGDITGRSPLTIRADANKIQGIVAESMVPDNCLQQGIVASDTTATCNTDKCDLQARVFSAAETTGQEADVGASVGQTFEQWMSNFYREPAPEGYSILADG